MANMSSIEIIKRALLGILFCLTLIPFSSARAGAPPGYTLAFDEDFSGPLAVALGYGWGPLTTGVRWTAHTPYSGDFGLAWFTGPGEPNTANPFSVSGGFLTVTAWLDPLRNHWRSGLLSSLAYTGAGFSQRFGYFEARMQLPAGAGTWPAFWLGDATALPKGSSSNNLAEIDILEAYGVDPTACYMTVHDWTPQGVSLYGTSHLSRLNGIESGFHTYGCLINPDYIHFYIDDVEQWKTPTYPDATHPLYVMVNLALQSTPVPTPSKLLVDYVRVYAPPR
jgi:glycosyl hydrolase family 16